MKTEDIVTSDLSQFGARERSLAADLLTASKTGFPNDFYDDGVTIMMNRNFGNVFLTNSDFQVCMMNGDKLESFYSCPECGHEGFFEEIENLDEHQSGNAGECRRWIKDVRAGR